MFPSEVISEMKPDGKLRPKIKNLIKQKGAYIIVSSGSCVTETAYDKRISAMKEAVANEPGNEDLKLDFWDRGRIATWVRVHPSMILRKTSLVTGFMKHSPGTDAETSCTFSGI